MYPAELKYVMIRENGLDVPIIFPKVLQHSQIARKDEVVSAGFCCVDGIDRLQCYGESQSLGVKSRPEDTVILKRYLYEPF